MVSTEQALDKPEETPERRILLGIKLSSEAVEKAAQLSDPTAAEVVASEGAEVVDQLKRALPGLHNLINIGERTYFLDPFSPEPRVITGDADNVVVYMAQERTVPDEGRTATPEDYATLIMGVADVQRAV
jgi:hypothetical protein